MGRILAVDPGEKRIGLAISDLTGTIANPLSVIEHTGREKDAEKIAAVAKETSAEMIVIGQPLDSDGQVGPQGRKSQRLADAIATFTSLPVALWDESDSTQIAKIARVQMNTKRAKRKGHLDDMAAVVILQSYLDSQIQNRG